MQHRSADRSALPGPALVRADLVTHAAAPDRSPEPPPGSPAASRAPKRPRHPGTPSDRGPAAADAAPAGVPRHPGFADRPAVVPGEPASLRIARRDVTVLALAARARFADPAAEQERDALLTEVHAAALDFARRLREHTLHAVVEYRGSHSAWDVMAECEAAYEAHERYATVARRAASRLAPLLVLPKGLD